MNDLEHVKRRIKKLLALSKSPNENEALSALEKAQKLMGEYGIHESSCVFEKAAVKSTKNSVLWRFVIAGCVAWLYGCEYYRNRHWDHGEEIFNGEELDVFMAAEMYRYLTGAVERIAKKNIRKNAKLKFRRDYKLGMAFSLEHRMREMGEAAAWSDRRESKLQAVKAHVKDTVIFAPEKPVKKPDGKKDKLNFTALFRGEDDAGGISLHRQAAGSGQRLLEGF